MATQFKKTQATVLAHQQQGAVLVVSLMLLLVMTLLSIASMSNSIMQEKMAANAQNTNHTFQAAESAVNAQITTIILGNTDELNAAMVSDTAQGTLFTINLGTDAVATSTAQVAYLGPVVTTGGSSMDADESSILLNGQRFELVGTGNVAAVQAQTQIRQGIEYH